jgi:hypothetical protein
MRDYCSQGGDDWQICYYFTETWEQFRLNGILDLIGSTELDPSKKTVSISPQFNIPLISMEND